MDERRKEEEGMDETITIVGPEPSDGTSFRKPGRVGIEALMLMAKYDDEFRELLLADRGRALDQCGIDLSPAERLVMEKISGEALSRHIERFEMPGVTRKSLPNWRAAASVMLLVSTILFGTAQCSILPGRGGSDQVETLESGWADDDTFRITMAGEASKTAGPDEWKQSARRAAVLNAQYRMLEQFKGYKLEAATGIEAVDPGGFAVTKQLKKLVKEGIVVRERYDEEIRACEVQLEVREKALKRLIQAAEWGDGSR
jgi:hypothetical protein